MLNIAVIEKLIAETTEQAQLTPLDLIIFIKFEITSIKELSQY
jgi:hypothetical protein